MINKTIKMIARAINPTRKIAPPTQINIDPINICNLRCPLCPTGLGNGKYKKSIMSFDSFKTIVNKIPSLQRIFLFNRGEPFLNPDIFQMIRYARGKNIEVCIHSNLNPKKDYSFFTQIVESGLNELIVSLDGASQESYSKYRKGGDFKAVISNIKELVSVKKKLKKDNPKIVWKFIVNKFNEQEISKAMKQAKLLGIEFLLNKIGLGDDMPEYNFSGSIKTNKKYWLPTNQEHIRSPYIGEYTVPLFNEKCKQLFETMFINPQGEVFPCCWTTDNKNSFGNLLHQSFDEVWNSKEYKYSRSMFVKPFIRPQKTSTICSSCNNFKKQ